VPSISFCGIFRFLPCGVFQFYLLCPCFCEWIPVSLALWLPFFHWILWCSSLLCIHRFHISLLWLLPQSLRRCLSALPKNHHGNTLFGLLHHRWVWDLMFLWMLFSFFVMFICLCFVFHLLLTVCTTDVWCIAWERLVWRYYILSKGGYGGYHQVQYPLNLS